MALAKNRGKAPLCKCGCGEYTFKHKEKWTAYRRGHMRFKSNPADAPRCECECGKRVKWGRGKWRQFRRGHSTKRMWENPNNRAKIVANMSVGVKHKWENPEYRAKVSAASKRRWENPEFRSKMVAASKRRCANPEFRTKQSSDMKRVWQNPVFRDKYIKGLLKARNSCPNNLESKFDASTEFSVRYVGNRAWWRKITYRLPSGDYVTAFKNPDFKVKGQMKVIELFGDYWHRGEFPEDLIAGYADAGVECLVLWEREVHGDLENVLRRVTDFITKDAPEYKQAEFAFAAGG